MESKIDKWLVFILACLCMFLSWCLGWQYGKGNNEPEQDTITITDTITKIDTLKVDSPVYKQIVKVETKYEKVPVIINDTTVDTLYAELNYETKEYSDSTYKAVVSGYHPSLDHIETYNKTEYITVDKIITKNKTGLYITPNVSVGYGVFNKKPDMYIGVGIGLKL